MGRHEASRKTVDHAQMGALMQDCANHAYDLPTLQAGLARFAFLLGSGE